MTIRESVPLAPLMTMQVGGRARYLAEGESESAVREAVQFAHSRSLPLFVLGGGSNLVIADQGWPGLVLRVTIGGIDPTTDKDTVLFDVGAGVNWDDFVAHAVELNCAGVECLSGIPGSVGGTPVQNVGAYGQEVAETIESVHVLDLQQDRVLDLDRAACGFHYRTSIFNTSQRGRYVILRVRFRLIQDGEPSVKYADLKKYFPEATSRPTLAQVRDAVREIRRSKGMLIVPGDPDCRSAGSFFKNPVLDENQFRQLTDRAEQKGLQVPSYPALDAQHKVSAAWLVEHSGFRKGFTLGAAGISHKHALALINTGEASAADIVRLKEKIQHDVEATWGIRLEPEPVFVGF